MATDDERREVAARLRQMSDAHDATEASRVDRTLGLEDRAYGTVIAFDSADIRSLADLIDPTCEMEAAGGVPAPVRDSLETFFCSECGSPIYNDVNPSYCLYCGHRVVDRR